MTCRLQRHLEGIRCFFSVANVMLISAMVATLLLASCDPDSPRLQANNTLTTEISISIRKKERNVTGEPSDLWIEGQNTVSRSVQIGPQRSEIINIDGLLYPEYIITIVSRLAETKFESTFTNDELDKIGWKITVSDRGIE